jgi:hypothetical protein
MAANPLPPTFNDYLTTTLGITDADLVAALNGQGLTLPRDFVNLTEEDVTKICNNIRKPGGTIPNPALAAPNPPANAPQTIPNPGISVGFVYEKRLQMLRYYVAHLVRTQRSFDADQATLNLLATIYALKEEEEGNDKLKLELPEKLKTVDKIRQSLENIDNYLTRKFGASGLPLMYIVRESVGLPLIDLGLLVPTIHDDMIARGPHTGSVYQADNREVWQVIRHVTHEGPGWSWVSSFALTRDGRSAYLAIKRHYLGESFTARLRSLADQVIETAYYDGKSRAFTFERYCEVLKNAFTDIESTDEVVSENRKVRVLLGGIQDPRLSQAKSQVLATPSLKATFEDSVNFISQFLDEKKSMTTGSAKGGTQISRNISAFSRGGRGRGRGNQRGGPGRGGGRGRQGNRGSNSSHNSGRGGRGGKYVSDQYYDPAAWAALTPEQQQKVRDLRAERDKRRGVEAVNTRNVRSRSDEPSYVSNDGGTTNSTLSSPSTTNTASVGAVMSQRTPRNL